MKPYYETKLGRLYHGDCLEIMPHLEPVDLVITDPQYTSPVITSFGRKTEKTYGNQSIQKAFFRLVKIEYERLIKEQSPVFIFCDYQYFPILFEVFYSWRTSQLLIWDKKRIGLGSPFRRRYEMLYFCSPDTGLHFKDKRWFPDILDKDEYKPVHSSKKFHGAQKPVPLVRDMIDVFSGDDSLVLDNFFGSGTTAIACERLNRKWIGIEIEEKYCEIAAKRIERETRQLKLWNS